MSSDSTALGDRMNCDYGDPRLPERIWRKIYPEPNTGCWLWGASCNQGGYGQVHYERRTRRVHHLVFEVLVEDTPERDLDHTCRTRCCANPAHLEPVSRQVNLARGVGLVWMKRAARKRCRNGHLLAGDNLGHDGNARRCKACHAESSRKSKARKRVAP